MASIEKGIVQWNGLPGGASVGVHFWKAGNATTVVAAMKTFYQNLAAFLPPSVSVVIPTTGEVLNDDDGKMTGTWGGVTALTVTGTSTSVGYSAQSGLLVQWRTLSFVNGRNVRGRTFIVPVAVSNFTAGGVIVAATANTAKTAADSFLTGSGNNLVVWHRPVYSKPPNSVLERPGASFTVTSTNVPTKVATLTGRRDA
jgi:hypothetical protein